MPTSMPKPRHNQPGGGAHLGTLCFHKARGVDWEGGLAWMTSRLGKGEEEETRERERTEGR